MINIGTIAVLATMSLCTSAVPEANHWEVIKDLTKVYNDARTLEASQAASAVLHEYLDGLTASQLIAAARDYAQEVQETEPYDLWIGAGMGLRFFWGHYPKASNGLRSVGPLLADMTDKNQPVFWRWMLCQLIGEWGVKLHPQQRLQAAMAMRGLFSDGSEPVKLRVHSVAQSSLLLAYAYENNLRNDPNVRSFVEEHGPDADYVTAVQQGHVRPSGATMKLDKETRAEITAHIAKQRELFAQADLPTDLRAETIRAWCVYRRRNLGPPELRTILSDAAIRFREFDEKLWLFLIRANLGPYQNHDLRGLLDQMIDTATDKSIRKQLGRFDKELRKKGL